MVHFRRICLASIVVCLLVLPTHADEQTFDTPEKVANAFLVASIKNNGSAMLACMTKVERGRYADEFKELQPRRKESKETFHLDDPDIQGNKATVKATLQNGNRVKAMLLECALEDGAWRICYDATIRKVNASSPDTTYDARLREVWEVLRTLKNRSQDYFKRMKKAPRKVSDLNASEEEMKLDDWAIVDQIRVKGDDSAIIIEAQSKSADDVYAVRVSLQDDKAEYLGMNRDQADGVVDKDAQMLLGRHCDNLRARFAASKAMPKTITGDGKSLTAFDLFSQHWIARDEVVSKGNTMILTADCIDETVVATWEFDIIKGGGSVNIALAYSPFARGKWVRAQTDLGEIMKALNGYKIDHGEYPDHLDAVKEQFDGKVPEDPFTGKPYAYELTTNGFKLICLGRDGTTGGRWKVDKDLVCTERGLAD